MDPLPIAAEAVENAPAIGPREQREVYDASGRLVRRLVLDGGALVEEASFVYDDVGDVVSEVALAEGHTTEVARTFDGGHVITEVTTVDGALTEQATWTWTGDHPATRVVTSAAGVLTTTWTWDAYGTAIAIETRDAAGTLVARVVADRAAPAPLPFRPAGIAVGFDAGLGSNSDVATGDVKLGFNLSRRPAPGTYDKDPLEVRFSVLYQVARSKGTLVNQYSDLKFGLDYNELVRHVTVFLFGDVERNPVANLQIDLEAAPIGVKFTALDGMHGALLDASVAPIWNYRSLVLPDGGDCEGVVLPADASCDFARAQASFRLRVGWEKGGVKIRDTVEFLPTLTPKSGTIVDAVKTEAVVRNTTALEVAVGKHFLLKESVVFARDPLLALQADCAAAPDSLLCGGYSVKTATTVGLTWTFQPPVN